MIQLNLLPDVKLEYIKARRTKRLVILSSAIVSGASFALMAMLFIATSVLQRQHMNNLNQDIQQYNRTLQEQDDLNRILTVQNQLNVLDALHAEKPAAGRLGNYLAQITPDSVTISRLGVDFSENTIEIEGSAPALRNVNEFIDTLKFTRFMAGEESGEAFSNVLLSSFERTEVTPNSNEDPVTYQITFGFEPVIFDNSLSVELDVPSTVTTQSADRPDPNTIFQQDNTGEEQ